ncbi:MAG: glycerophosphodiester phosphodiesterase [Rhodospirillales bacterium]
MRKVSRDKRLSTAHLIGHRGVAGLAPENTLAGFHRAGALGLGMVEFDVMLTRDNQPVVIHDETLERTTNGQGRVAEIYWAALEGLDAGSWFAPEFAGEGVPSLMQVAIVLSRLTVNANIEIKPSEGRDADTGLGVAAAVQRCWPHVLEAPLFSSFSFEALTAAQAVTPNGRFALLYGRLPAEWRGQAEEIGAEAIHLNADGLDEAEVAAVKAAGLDLRVYTVNDREEAQRMIALGVDQVFTDHPERLLGDIQ